MCAVASFDRRVQDSHSIAAKVLSNDGNGEASARLRKLLDNLRHFRRIKHVSAPNAIVISEPE
jgi:hypothetical protein